MVEIETNCIKRVTGRNCRIECEMGSLWITYKYGQDIILNSGESIILDGKRNIVVQGLKDSKYRVVPAP